MTVNNLNNFLDKVMTIEISTLNRFLDLSRYRQTSDTAEDMELKKLQQDALTELLMFDNTAIQKQLNRMDQIKQRFDRFSANCLFGKYTEFKNGTLDNLSFIENIKQFFIVPKFQHGRITNDFILDLSDAVMYKSAYLSGFIEQVKKNSQLPDGATSIKSFSWTGTPDQLQALWQALKVAGYIHPDTTNEAFAAIFAEDLSICTPIKWTASNRLLSYLFNQMFAGNFISKEWQSIIEKYKLFQKRNNKPFKAGDLASALSEINSKGLEPKGYEKIDEILKTLRQSKA